MRRTLQSEGERAARLTNRRAKSKPTPHNGEMMRKWALYTARQKEVILAEFRRRFPDDYYCKTTFFRFLHEKLIDNEQHEGAVEKV